jgi:hypothetical protein
VGDLSRADFEGHGRANLLGDRRRLPRRLRDPRRDGGHPVGSEGCLGFGLGEPSTPFAERAEPAHMPERVGGEQHPMTVPPQCATWILITVMALRPAAVPYTADYFFYKDALR